MARGALAKGPSYSLGKNQKQLASQQKDLEARLRLRPNDQFLRNALKQVRGALSGKPSTKANTPPTEEQAANTPPSQEQIAGQANQVQSGLMNQMQEQGAFNPGDFNQAAMGAQDAAMQQFNLYNQPKFQQQEQNFQQMAASRGWAPDSKIYQTAHANMQREQDQASQGAMAQAYQSGLGAQAQGFGQSATAYQMPYQNMGAFNGLNNIQAAQGLQQGAQNFKINQEMPLAQKYAMQLQNSQYHGNPALAYQNAIGLQNNAAMNSIMVNQATGQPVYPNYGFGNGFAQGIGAALPGVIGNVMES